MAAPVTIEPTSISVDNVLFWISVAVFAFIGGIIREFRTPTKKKTIGDWLAEGIVSFFTGTIIATLASSVIADKAVLFGLAGLSGYFGIAMLDNFRPVVMTVIGSRLQNLIPAIPIQKKRSRKYKKRA